MIRITVEMVPKGDRSKAFTLAQGIISNDGTGNETTSNYIYGLSGQAKRPGHDPGIQISGRVMGFPRKREDVWALLLHCLQNGDQGLIARNGQRYDNP